MKYLTPIYLTLMHAFENRADHMLKLANEYTNGVSLMQEYCTLRLDGGRQSGKTEAVVEFAYKWLNRGGSVSIISISQSYAKTTENKLIKFIKEYDDYDKYRNEIVTTSIRDFLSKNCCKYRGMSFGRQLIIIDEPLRAPEMLKFYEAYYEHVIPSTYNRAPGDLPLFFVIGMQ